MQYISLGKRQVHFRTPGVCHIKNCDAKTPLRWQKQTLLGTVTWLNPLHVLGEQWQMPLKYHK